MLFNHEMLNFLCIFKDILFGIKHVLFTVTNTFSSLKIGQQTTKCYNNVSQYRCELWINFDCARLSTVICVVSFR